jgi:hypothetical protein
VTLRFCDACDCNVNVPDGSHCAGCGGGTYGFRPHKDTVYTVERPARPVRAPRPTVRICYRPECAEPPAFLITPEGRGGYHACVAHLGVLLLTLPDALPARVDRFEEQPTGVHRVPR